MLIFRAEDDIEQWVSTTGEKRGEYLTLQKVWELPRLWYHNRMSQHYRGRTIEEVHAIKRILTFFYETFSSAN